MSRMKREGDVAHPDGGVSAKVDCKQRKKAGYGTSKVLQDGKFFWNEGALRLEHRGAGALRSCQGYGQSNLGLGT